MAAFEQQLWKKAHIVRNIMINSLKGASFLIFLIVIPGGYFKLNKKKLKRATEHVL